MAVGCAATTTERLRLPPLQTIPHVDLSRYLGTWYEIANFPQGFQRGCTGTTATYESIVTRLEAQGYDTSRLVRTAQVAGRASSALVAL